MNVVFLDIDGVLNSLPYLKFVNHSKNKFCEIDESKLPILEKIVKDNNAQIVLSSTWKCLDCKDEPSCYAMWQYLVDVLAKYDLQISSKTPSLANKRPLEIKAWLDEHSSENVKWISLDDDYDEFDYEACGLSGHLIHTKFFVDDINDGGLLEKHIILAKEIFKKQ